MQAGKLRHRLVIEAPTITTDLDGGQVVTMRPVGTPVWGAITPVRMTEAVVAGQVAARGTHRITLRWGGVLPPSYQLREGTRVFEITESQNMDERDRQLNILAIERTEGN